MRQLRLGISGCGRLAEEGYLPALRDVPGLRLVAVADPDLDRRHLVAKRAWEVAGVRPATHARVTEMLDRSAPEAVVVASPPREHVGDAALASRAGLTALVEKPPAPESAGAVALTRLPHPPFVGFNRRFSGVAELREAIPREGELDLRLELRYRRAAWRPVSVRDDAAGDLGPHLVDLALWLGDAEPVEVRALELREERARIELSTTSGTAMIACATDRPHLELVQASAGGWRRTWRDGGIVRNGLARMTPGEPVLVASLRAQLRAYEAALRGRPHGPLASPREGLAVMRVIDAARESWSADGAAVRLAGTGVPA